MKDFDGWSIKKKSIDLDKSQKLYQVRDIWWCSLGVNIGREQDGKNADFLRPVLILKGLSKDTCLVAPLTASIHEHPYRVNVGRAPNKESKVVLSQIRVIDSKRLVQKILKLDLNTFEIVKNSLIRFLS